MASGPSVYWLELLWAERPGACGNALLIWLVAFVQSQNELLAVWLGVYCSDLAGKPEHFNRVPAYLHVGEGCKQWHSLALRIPKSFHRYQRAPAVSQPFIYGLSHSLLLLSRSPLLFINYSISL